MGKMGAPKNNSIRKSMTFGPRILSQWIKDNQFAAWYFDGVNPIGEKVFGATRQEALDNLYNRACAGK